MGDNIYRTIILIFNQDEDHNNNNNSIDKLKNECFLKNASVIYTNTQLVFFFLDKLS